MHCQQTCVTESFDQTITFSSHRYIYKFMYFVRKKEKVIGLRQKYQKYANNKNEDMMRCLFSTSCHGYCETLGHILFHLNSVQRKALILREKKSLWLFLHTVTFLCVDTGTIILQCLFSLIKLTHKNRDS